MGKFLLVLVVLVMGVLLASCSTPVHVGVDCGLTWTDGDVAWDENCRVPVDLVLPTPEPTQVDTPTLTPTNTLEPTGTFTPTPTYTETPTPTFTNTEITTATSTDTETPTVEPISIPYGPFHNSNYQRKFFTGAIISGGEWGRMHEIRDTGLYHILAAAAISDPCAYYTEPFVANTWQPDVFIADILARKQEILSHHADGTLIGLIELNEPHNPDKARCVPVPQYLLAEAANSFWANFPELSPDTFYFGYWTPPTYLEGYAATGVNVTAVQFTAGRGAFLDWVVPLEASARRQGQKLIYSANLSQLGVVETVAINILECQRDLAVMVTLWADQYVSDADAGLYQTALDACR